MFLRNGAIAVILAAAAAPATAQAVKVAGTGIVSSIVTAQGTMATGTVKPGDALSFGFTFDAAGAPLLFDGGPANQRYGLSYSGFNTQIGGTTFVPDPDTANNAYVSVGTGFAFLGGQRFSEPALIQEFGFRGTGTGLPFTASATATAVFTLTSFFRQNLDGATPTLANLRDPREAARTNFRLTVSDNGRAVGFVQGSVTAAFAAVPEPGTWALLILGFAAIGGAMRRRSALTVRFA